jgi:hypothetical protein
MPNNELNIFQRMGAITQELGVVAKNLQVGFGNSRYKAVSERDILDAVKPLEAKYGVYSYPLTRKVVEASTDEREGKQGSTIREHFMRVETTYRFLCMDKPESYIDIVTYGDGIDPGDKATGKAMTYADKYALMKAYKISTGDDPDKYAGDDYAHEGTYTPSKPAEPKKATENQLNYIRRAYCRPGDIQKLLEKNNLEHLEDMTFAKASDLIEKLRAVASSAS